MVQNSFSPALLQTYQTKCSHIHQVNIRALTSLCGLDQPAKFQKNLLNALNANVFKSDIQIKSFIEHTASHVKSNSFVLNLFRNTIKSYKLTQDIENLQKYQYLAHINQLIKENKVDQNKLSEIDKTLMDPKSDFVQNALKVNEMFQNPETLDEINNEEEIAKLIEQLLNDLEEKTLEKIKEKEQKKYEELFSGETITDDSEFEDDSGKFSWEKFREKVIWAALDKIANEKTLTDMGFKVGLVLAFEAPYSFMKNICDQIEEIRKTRAKKTTENRKNHIKDNLKKHALDPNKLSALLAREAMVWILDNSETKDFDKTSFKPKEKSLKIEWEKSLFADQLPKDINNNFIFSLFTKKQKRNYIKYLKKYANSTTWIKRSCYLTGMYLTKEEQDEIIKNAVKKAFNVKLEQIKELSSSELVGKLKNIHQTHAYQKKQAVPAPQNNLLVPISDEIGKLVNNINNNIPLSQKEMSTLKQGLIKTGATPYFINNVFSFFENKKPLPFDLKDDIFEILASNKMRNTKLAPFIQKYGISVQQLAKHSLQEFQNSYLVTKWQGIPNATLLKKEHQRTG
ncbi:MAG: hypothetical protein J6V53_00710 [Alphaproteobacteria bacterium]|nr:hypothetical protein [Alphaproteobacteria bacterium]